MSIFGELYGVDQRGALQFFFTGLKDIIPKQGELTTKETLYVASVLAHFSQTSRCADRSMPTLAGLAEFFDCFVLSQIDPQDAETLEVAGAQSLLFAGFFGDQMERRHNLNWFNSVGRSFYERAGHQTQSIQRKTLLWLMASHFSAWTRFLRYFSRNLRERPYLINLPGSLES